MLLSLPEQVQRGGPVPSPPPMRPWLLPRVPLQDVLRLARFVPLLPPLPQRLHRRELRLRPKEELRRPLLDPGRRGRRG